MIGHWLDLPTSPHKPEPPNAVSGRMAGPHRRAVAARPTPSRRCGRSRRPAPVSLWETVVQRKLIGDDQVLAALAARFRFPVADLSRIDAQLIQAVPEQLARRFNVVPVGQTDSYLEVATANPFDIDAEKMLAFATGREVRMLLASPAKLQGQDRRALSQRRGGRQPAAGRHRRRPRGQGADRGRRGFLRRERRRGQPAPDHPAGGHDAGRRRGEPGERHPRRADRGRRGGALPHRRRAAPGDEDPAQRRACPSSPASRSCRASISPTGSGPRTAARGSR